MPSRGSGNVEFAPPRRVTPRRVFAGLVLLGLLGGLIALVSGWLPPARPHIKVARVEVPIPPKAPPPAPVTAAIPPVPPLAAAPATKPPPSEPAPPQTALLPVPAAPAPPPQQRTTAQPLLPAPDPALVEKTPRGPLPIIGRDGRQPWHAYARPFDRADKRPRIAIVITGLGPSGAATEAAINELPGAITLAFDPYTRRLSDWIQLARAAGHEVLLSLPMEPVDYPRQDPGPYTLLTTLSAKDNVERLDWALSRVSGYVGVINMMGSRFTTSETNLVPVFEELRKRGLMFIDSRASEQSVASTLAQSMGLPHLANDDTLDAEATRDAIDRNLGELETEAKRDGRALGVGFAYPVTLERVALWAKTLDGKGIALAPASALPPLASPPPERKGAAK